MYYILHKDNKLVGVALEEPMPDLQSIGVLAEGNPGAAKPGISTGTITQSKGIAVSAVAESDPSYLA